MKNRHTFPILLVVAIMLSTLSMNAQTRKAVDLGFNMTNLHMKQKLVSIDDGYGFKAGVTVETMFPGIGFGINTGAYYSLRGATMNLGERKVWQSDGFGSVRTYLHYLEIPFHLRFKWTRMSGFEDYIAPFVYGGPTLGLMLGHGKVDALEYSFGEIGLTGGFGLELFKNWQLKGEYTWGMSYALKTVKLDNYSGRNRQLSIALSYFF